MRFGSVTNVMREKELLPGCLELLDGVERVCIFSDRSYMDLPVEDDGSKEIARKYAHVIETSTRYQSEMRNLGLQYLQDIGVDYALIVDTDEWWPRRTLEMLTRAVEDTGKEVYQFRLSHMFRRPDWNVPSPNDRGTVVVMRTDQRFEPTGNRVCTGNIHGIITPEEARIFHFSYVRSPDKIAEKIKNFSHAPEVIPGWFENVFLPCTQESKNVHPTVPEAWPEIRVLELPGEIRSRIPEHLWTV